MKVLVLNCGSSSIKYQLYEMPAEDVVARGLIQRIGSDESEAILQKDGKKWSMPWPIHDHQAGITVMVRMLTDPEKGVLSSMAEIKACGHRVVHGGERFTGSVLVDKELEKAIEEFFELAPLHNPPNLTGIREAKNVLGNIPQVACFDTAFHQTIPPVAYLYGLPYDMYEEHKVRRYGFHGTSHRYVARRAARLMDRGKYDADLITCHLGNGCSIAAVKGGRSVDTSMGLTPLEGLVMGTRTGDLDPALVFYLIRRGYTVEDLDRIFNKESGMLGISGISNDMRDLAEKAEEGNARARLARDIFAYRIRKYIGSYMAVLNGCDGIVFTGGIGENDWLMRKQALCEMDQLGIQLDERKNQETVGQEGAVHAQDSRVRVFVIPTNEEAAIARDTYERAGKK